MAKTISPSPQVTRVSRAAEPMLVTHIEALVEQPKTASPGGMSMVASPRARPSRLR
jgi:hypothetical protein